LTANTPASGPGIWAVAYLGSFNPANLQQNYLADSGFSTWSGNPVSAFSFTLPAGATAVVVVQNVDPGIQSQYQLVLDAPGAAAEVPEGDTLLLMGGGLGGLATWLRWQWSRRRAKK
jgi:hypothetical protein